MKNLFTTLILFAVLSSLSFSQNRVDLMMTSTWQTYQWPMNAAFPGCQTGIYGEVNNHLGNSCGPTALAKMLHFNRHPVSGKGTYSMTDEYGIRHNFNFGNTTFKWNLMKDEFPSNASEVEYMPTAELVYNCYGLMEDPDNTGRNIYDISYLLKKYMRYSSAAYVAYRFDYTDDEFTEVLKSELDAGRTILIESWTSNSTPPGENGNHAGHYWNIDGYDEQDRFHMILNNDNYEGWCKVEDMVQARHNFDAYYIWALINAKPDETAKEFALTLSEADRMFETNKLVNLSWEQQNIEVFDIDVTYDGEEWITIGENISSASGSWSWDGLDRVSRDIKFRVRDAVNEYYDFILEGFESYDEKMLSIVTPVSGDTYEDGSKVCVAWEYGGITELKFEIKESNSEDWQTIEREMHARNRFNTWPLPGGSGIAYDFRLSSLDGEFIDVVENVTVGTAQEVGGPYVKDYYSLLMMHFDNNFAEECMDAEVIIEGRTPGFDYSANGKGAALHLNNSERSYMSYIEIPAGDDLSLRGSFTVDLWFKIKSWDNLNTNKPLIIGKPISGARVNYSLTGNANKGTIIFKSRTTAGDVKVECKEGIIVPGVWYHAAMIHDANTREMKLLLHNERKERIDEQIGTYPEGAGIMVGTTNLVIGKKITSTSYLDGCVDELRISNTIRAFDAVWSGIEEVRKEVALKVYPNPATESIYVEIPDGLRVSGCVLRDVVGKVVRRDYMDAHEGRVRTVDVSGLRAGLYWLVVETSKGRIAEKVVVK